MLKESYTEHTISSDKARVGVTTKGCAVTSWKVKDATGVFKDLLYQGNTLQRTGIPLCFPYFGQREGQSGKHGFGRDSLWRLVATDESCVKLHLTHEEISELAQKAYPYAFSAEVQLTAVKDGSLAYSLQVKNTGEEIAKAILRLKGDSDLRDKLVKNAYNKVSAMYFPKPRGKFMLDLFSKLLKNK